MNLAKKFVFHCVVITVVIGAALCSEDTEVEKDLREGGTCLVPYLQRQEKLSIDFNSTSTLSELQCFRVTPVILAILKTVVHVLIKQEITNDSSDCLSNKFDDEDAIDYIIKIGVLDISSSLSESDRKTQLEVTRNEFKQELKKIAAHCQTDDKDFVKIFNDNLGIKNDSVEAAQDEYCLVKYAVDKKVLELGNLDMNPQNIDSNSVDCDHIIDIDKRKKEKELTDRSFMRLQEHPSMSCIEDNYRNMKVYDWGIALKLINKLDFSRETKEAEINKIFEKIGKFILSVRTCLGENI